MNIIKPEKLKNGDTIGIITLSGDIQNRQKVLNSKKYFEKKGYKVVLSENIFDKKRYLSGEDDKKVEELHKFFKNPEIKAVICARGGYGTIRLLDKIDYKIINENPKIFAGFSDVTALNAIFLKRANLLTFYAPMAAVDFGSEDISKITEKSFFNAIKGNVSEIKPDLRKSKTYSTGNAEGVFFGGNLATVVSLCGIDFIPDEKFIFFAEDLAEPDYKIDKMYTQLFNIEKFRKNVTGLILGDFLDIINQKYVDEFFTELGQKYKIPILSGFRITHRKNKVTVPYGINAKFSTDDRILKFDNY
jgi:muramoyltetrapeptide carboxypeptidase